MHTWSRAAAWLLVLAGSVSLPGCPGCASYRRCEVPSPVALGALPQRLSETGLFIGSGEELAPGVRAYEPAFPLWSDGAEKRRWVLLPGGARIDTSDLDDWSFPVGSKFWKEFSFEGRRIETRLLVKVGASDADWAGAAYLWDADQKDARLAAEGVKDAFGLDYDVPSAADCRGCHGGRKSHVLGFSAQQLASSQLPLSHDELVSEGWLTHAPTAPLRVPGGALDRAALGYLHANFGLIHPALMTFSALLVHAGGMAVRRTSDPRRRHHRLGMTAAAALAIILAAVPWPALGFERPWFRL